ncbi:LAME_0G13564g1_1 [Lachancea meyersii CBS 8951]|uniref:intramembrane prenyl-peptidase Rce1 n=1 Tax=Lachancea meyersii CBS 8951 TaxID=1266667 RepID=A0A1G4KA53_9SACH|nr:LAME_0G13564g1_1 [Lachancea meyersii CBS 8951]
MDLVPFSISLYVSVSYIAAIHLWSGNIRAYKIRRDDPRVIKSRLRRVSCISLVNLVLVPWLISNFSTTPFKKVFFSLGLLPGRYVDGDLGLVLALQVYLSDILRALKLACILYCGPLLDNSLYYLLVPGEGFKSLVQDLKNETLSIWGFRNYVFGPLTEELFFTSMVTNCMLLTQPGSATLTSLLWISPLFFGLAHVHHGWEMHSTGLYGLPQIMATVLLQFTYTTIFGAFTNFVFMRTGRNFWCCVFLHTFANYMGLPQGSELAVWLDSNYRSTSLRSFLGSIFKYAYVALLVLGLIGFKDNLYTLTGSKYAIEL